MTTSLPTVSWTHQGQHHERQWVSPNGATPPRSIVTVDDKLTADAAHRFASQGTAMLYLGDYRNARQLLSALARRLAPREPKRGAVAAARKKSASAKQPASPKTVQERFYQYRQARSQRARVLSMVLVPVSPGADAGSGPAVELSHAPDVQRPWVNAFGPLASPAVISLQDLLGAIGAEQWRSTGVDVPFLEARITPHYGTFAPVRGEYLELVARAELGGAARAFDIGTGTGVLAAILARRGLEEVVGTDTQERAVACANANFVSLGLSDRARAVQHDLFPEGEADIIVCNPPWLPGTPKTLLDYAIYDPKSQMLRAFLSGLPRHLAPGGEGWLVISDLAERLELRSREELLGWVAAAGLKVLGRDDTTPQHARAADKDDPFHAERSAEITSLWRLGRA